MYSDICIANIGRRERDKRMKFGVVLLAFAALAAFGLLALDVNRLYRISLFLPLWLGAIGIFQARAKT